MAEEELVLIADGRRDFTLTLPNPPIRKSSVRLWVKEPGDQLREWDLVDDLQAAEADAPVYSLDVETGTTTFGDGAHGRIPPAGATIRVRYSRRTAERRNSEFKRVHYVRGMVLEAGDFEQEQQYHVGKRRLLNRCLFGCRVACGLEVKASLETVAISAGLALDCCGREIVVPEPIEITPPEELSARFLTIRYSESAEDQKRIVEGFQIQWQEVDPLSNHVWHGEAWVTCGEPHAMTLARVQLEGDEVTLDEEIAKRIEVGRRCWCS